MTKEETTKTSTKNRGTSFPVLSLPEAVKIIRDAGAYGKTMTPSALAAYAGHQSATSGPWKQKAAALREWGLISTINADKIGLTTRALQIAYPESAEKAQAAMLECFQGSQLYMSIYEDLAKGNELQLSSLGNKAVTSHGVSIASKDKFVNSFVESAAAVDLAERIGTDKVKILPMLTSELGEMNDSDDEQDLEVSNNNPAESQDIKRMSTSLPVMNQIWEFDGGEITIAISAEKPLQAKTYAELSKVVEAVENLVIHLGVKQPAEVELEDATK